jgi:sugar phosphate permease
MGFRYAPVTKWLEEHRRWGVPTYGYVVAAITYFCMYSLRKPFSAAKYEGLRLGAIDLKILLVTIQIIGYTISKFGGIVIISRLDKKYRGLYIVICVSVAELALVLFGIVPITVKPVCLFFNGLPLGLIWGLVFSFLEGRAASEFLATSLCMSFIWGSGLAKSVA